MAMASANAIARIAIVCTLLAASGFLPIAFKAEEPIQPIEIAGKIAPRAMVPATANVRIPSISMFLIIINNIYFNDALLRATPCVRKSKLGLSLQK